MSIGLKCLDKVIRYTITIIAIIIALKISLYIIDLDSNKIHSLYDSIKNLGIINFYKDGYSSVGLGNVFNTFVKSLKEMFNAIF